VKFQIVILERVNLLVVVGMSDEKILLFYVESFSEFEEGENIFVSFDPIIDGALRW